MAIGKRTKGIGMLAVCGLLGLSIAGCSSAGSDKSTNTIASTESASTASHDTTQVEQKGKISVAVFDYGNMPKEQGTLEKNWATEWINQNGPAEVQYVPIPRWTDKDKYNVLFAAGGAPDLIWTYDSSLKNQLIDQQELMPLDDLIAKSSTTYKKLLDENPGLKKMSTAPDGHIYQVGRLNGLQPNHVLMIRNDWLKKLGLPVPQNTDDLMNVAKAFANQDPDGNGKPDTHGMALSFITGFVIDAMFGNMTPVLQDGKVLVNPWERMKASTQFKKQLFDENIVDKDFLNDKDGTKAKQDWQNGKLGIFASSYWDKDIFEGLLKANPDAEVITIPLPKSSFGQFSPTLIPSLQLVGAVNAKVKDPVAVMKYIDYITEKSTAIKLNYGDQDTDYSMVNGCQVLKDPQNPKLAFSYVYNMLYSSGVFGECASYVNTLHPDTNPADKAWAEIYKQAEQNYLNPETPYPALMPDELRPALPNDLQTINSTVVGSMTDVILKSVVSGSSYTSNQAISDAKDLWNQAGGEKIDAWWQSWYDNNKDNAYLTKDLYIK